MKLREEIEAAHRKVQRVILRTPTVFSDAISKLSGLHERAAKDISIGFSKVVLALETRGPEHIQKIKHGLTAKGYSLRMLV